MPGIFGGRFEPGDEPRSNAERLEQLRKSPDGRLRRVEEDGIIIEEFDPDRAPNWRGVIASGLLIGLALAAPARAVSPSVLPSAFFVAPHGSDSAAGTLAAPFASLDRCRAAMAGSAIKLCYVRAGFYPASVASNSAGCNNAGNMVRLSHEAGDDGETFAYYPPDGALSAIFDGRKAVPTAICLSHVSHVTVRGLSFHHFGKAALQAVNFVADDGHGQGNTFIGNAVYASGIGISGWVPDTVIQGNKVVGAPKHGIGAWTAQHSAAGGLTGLWVQDNVVLHACMTVSDCGAIYIQDYQVPSSNNIIVNSNKIYNASGGKCIYLDDGTSNADVGNNQCVAAGGPMYSAFHIHGGSGNRIHGNAVDIGSNPKTFILQYQTTAHAGAWPMTGNQLVANKFSCHLAARCGGGFTASGSKPAHWPVVTGNQYRNDLGKGFNLAGGGGFPNPGDR